MSAESSSSAQQRRLRLLSSAVLWSCSGSATAVHSDAATNASIRPILAHHRATVISDPLLPTCTMLPVFKDFDKPAADLLNEDFGLKYTLKTKSGTPYGVVLQAYVLSSNSTELLSYRPSPLPPITKVARLLCPARLLRSGLMLLDSTSTSLSSPTMEVSPPVQSLPHFHDVHDVA